MPGLQVVQKLWTQLNIELREEVEGDYRSLANIGLKEVLFQESHALSDVGLTCIVAALGDPLRIDINAHSTRAMTFGGSNHQAAIAAAEVIHDVIFRDTGDPQHLIHNAVGGWNILHIGSPRLRVTAQPYADDG